MSLARAPLVIALDGPAAAGKGTLARRLAAHYGLAYLDSGALYRAVGLAVLRQGGDPADPETAAAAARALDAGFLGDPELRSEAAGNAASLVAALPAVRAALLGWQRRFAAGPPAGAMGAVLDGRDIGTVVCPEAPVKIFVTASPAARAARRLRELQEAGRPAIYAQVLEDLQARDQRDQTRAAAPLRPAADAVTLDTSDLTIEEVFARARAIVDAILDRAPGLKPIFRAAAQP